MLKVVQQQAYHLKQVAGIPPIGPAYYPVINKYAVKLLYTYGVVYSKLPVASVSVYEVIPLTKWADKKLQG